MSMHLERPGLTTTGKKKGKQKFASADSKYKAQQLAKEWEDMMQKWEPRKLVKKVFKTTSLAPAMSTPRATGNNIKSLVTPGGDCTKKEPTMYTGDKVIGIAVLHKSCLQPIFNEEAAIEVAKMRR